MTNCLALVFLSTKIVTNQEYSYTSTIELKDKTINVSYYKCFREQISTFGVIDGTNKIPIHDYKYRLSDVFSVRETNSIVFKEVKLEK